VGSYPGYFPVPHYPIQDKGPFRSILVNPHWQFHPRIASLPIQQISAGNCHLYLWATNPRLGEATQLMDDWGFAHQDAIVLCKVENEDDPIPGSENIETLSEESGFFVEGPELLLLGLKGTADTKLDEQVNLIKWTQHSVIRRFVEQNSHGPYLELFSQEYAEGWARWAPLN
jgi:N6-adenosine-specific RNA methylase IME4